MSEAAAAPKVESRLEAVRSALESGTLRMVRRMMQSLHPAEIASLLESLRPAEREIVWELVDYDDDGEVLLHVNDEVRAGLIEGMDAQELLDATDGLEMDDLADLFSDLPETVTQKLLRSMDQQNRERLESVLSYPEDSAGGLMNTDTITVRPDVTLDVVLRYLRAHGQMPTNTDRVFVVNRYGRFLGTLPLTDVITGEPGTPVAEVMDREVHGISAETKADEVARIFEDHDLVSAAVINNEGVLLGRITIDDVVDVIRDQGEHSIMVMAGLDEEDDMFAPVFTSARRRAVWLGINLCTAFLAAWVVGLFEATLEKAVALAVLMPIIPSMGGIAGTQTLTIVIRGMALGQVERSNARWLVIKEMAVGFINGLTWAVVVGTAAFVWFGDWKLGMVIGGGMLTNLIAAALAGASIPLFLKRIGIDPALSAGVILTTFTDVIGFMAFLGIGTLVLL